MRVRRILLGALAALLSLPVLAADKPKPADAADKPDIALLEYLGEWQTAKGKWIDPMDIRPEDARTKAGNSEDPHER